MHPISILRLMPGCGIIDSQKYILSSPELSKLFKGNIKSNTNEKRSLLIPSDSKAPKLRKLHVSHVLITGKKETDNIKKLKNY